MPSGIKHEKDRCITYVGRMYDQRRGIPSSENLDCMHARSFSSTKQNDDSSLTSGVFAIENFRL